MFKNDKFDFASVIQSKLASKEEEEELKKRATAINYLVKASELFDKSERKDLSMQVMKIVKKIANKE